MKTCDHTCARSRVGGSVMMEFVLVVPIYLLLFGGTFWVGEMMLAQDMRLHSVRATAWAAGLRGTGTADTDNDDDDSDKGLDVRPSVDSLRSILSKRRRAHWIHEVNNWPMETHFPADTIAQFRYMPEPGKSWAQIVGGVFSPEYRRSVWTHGWFEGGRSLLASVAETRNADNGAASGGGGSNSNIYGYRVVMRTRVGEMGMRHLWAEKNTVAHLTYEKDVPALSSEWMKMVQEPYPWDDVTWNALSTLNNTHPDGNGSYNRPQHLDYRRYKMLTNWSNQRVGVTGVLVDGMYNDIKAAVEDVIDAFEDGMDVLNVNIFKKKFLDIPPPGDL